MMNRLQDEITAGSYLYEIRNRREMPETAVGASIITDEKRRNGCMLAFYDSLASYCRVKSLPGLFIYILFILITWVIRLFVKGGEPPEG
jgi:hypothetical protein